MVEAKRASTRRSFLLTARRLVWTWVAVAALGSGICLFLPWHEIERIGLFGPRQPSRTGAGGDATAGDRAAAPQEREICTGLAHLHQGALPVAMFAALAVLALAVQRARRARTHLAVAVLSILVALAVAYDVVDAILLRHLFADVGPEKPGEYLFWAGFFAVLLGLPVAAILHGILAWRVRKQGPAPASPANAP